MAHDHEQEGETFAYVVKLAKDGRDQFPLIPIDTDDVIKATDSSFRPVRSKGAWLGV